jgi:hypothetical protein
VERRATVPLNEFLLVGDLVMHVAKPLLVGHGYEGERLCNERCYAMNLLPTNRGNKAE